MRHSPQVWTSKSLIAHDFGVHRWIIKDLLPVGGIALMYGKRGCGKSNLAFTLLRNILDQTLFLGRYGCESERILYLSVDMPESTVQERVSKAFPDAPENILWALHSAPMDIMTEHDNAEWLVRGREFAPSLVVIDTSRKVHLMDENVSVTPTALYGRIKDLFEPGTGFLILHHSNKTIPKFTPPVDEDFKGNTAWIDGCDLGLHIKRNYNKLLENQLVQQVTISRQRFTDEAEGNRMRLNAARMLMEVDDK